jgi:RNA polymerase sigma-70 factor (ECF subfamily)
VSTPTRRDRDWLDSLFADHHRAVLVYATRRVPAADADDVLAEVFATAWQHRERIPEPPLPWLYRTASHHVLHVYRARGRRDSLAERLAAEPSSSVTDHAEQVAQGLDDKARVARAMAALTPQDAEILRLASWEQLDTDEIAYVLGCSRAAAKVRLHRARRRIAARLEQPATTTSMTSLEVTA